MPHKQPRISIITVVRNSGNLLTKTIQSVASQTYHDFEYVVIDGGSNDETPAVIREFESTISFWESRQDNGVYYAMNRGLSLVSGDFVFFLNAGDYFYANTVLEKVAAALRESHDPAVLYGLIAYSDPLTERQRLQSREFSVRRFQQGKTVTHQAVFCKTTLIRELRGFNTEYRIAADFDLFCRILEAGAAPVFFPSPIVVYQGGGLSATSPQVSAEKIQIVREHYGVAPSALMWLRSSLLKLARGFVRLFRLEKFYHVLKYRFGIGYFE